MSNKQIQRIKTALSDGSCESVIIEIRDKNPDWNDMFLLTRDNIESIDYLQYCAFKSVKYNRRTYADLEAGDTVNAPDSHYGDGVINVIDDVSREPFQVVHFVSGAVEYYERHELILLEKASD